ncbi:geranylgeranyl reductase family protein [Gordonia sp. (in: high G+C Gram-positive bacteria)]|uniref:geranylgeranyl reductase family protein n=1 Tax=Gordonia sp. (in: high G+C Gram-positive bacteria) TaxID=84139 RepID=UPI0016933D15|nr:geranylgeranyl reductase family protein [Gordonia sp. (in: high G+C Gram-positive bacteria)]NLG47545.1 geranylgeranyl reductase family protein [Gordonia sp. (in: high G+C Gram-positive bacteria)]
MTSATPGDAIPESTDLLVVGAGPAGAAAAARAAARGIDVVLLDAAVFPRDKTCGDGLTPRAVVGLQKLGLTSLLEGRPRIRGLELNGWGARQLVDWPGANRFGAHGSAIARTELDDAIRLFALEQGAAMVSGAKAIGAQLVGGRIESVTVTRDGERHQIRVRDVIVADGVRSALGKSLGRQWHRDTAFGVAARSYVDSGRADSEWMGSHLELRDPDGALLPGYGWVFPLGDGTVNVGVGALATAKRPASMALRPILEHYASMVTDDWQLTSRPRQIASALLPMGGAVSGVAGANWMLIGDAAACVNPLNGEGIDYAIETAMLAVEMLADENDYSTAWPALLRTEYGAAFAAARRAAGLLTVPQTVPLLGRPGIRSAKLMSTVVRVMGNLLTADDADLIARAWRSAGRVTAGVEDRPPFS